MLRDVFLAKLGGHGVTFHDTPDAFRNLLFQHRTGKVFAAGFLVIFNATGLIS